MAWNLSPRPQQRARPQNPNFPSQITCPTPAARSAFRHSNSNSNSRSSSSSNSTCNMLTEAATYSKRRPRADKAATCWACPAQRLVWSARARATPWPAAGWASKAMGKWAENLIENVLKRKLGTRTLHKKDTLKNQNAEIAKSNSPTLCNALRLL